VRKFKQKLNKQVSEKKEVKSHEQKDCSSRTGNFMISATFALCNELYVVFYYYSLFYAVVLINNFMWEESK